MRIRKSTGLEHKVLNSMLNDNGCLETGLLRLRDKDFVLPENKNIFRAIKELRTASNADIDVNVLSESKGIPLEAIADVFAADSSPKIEAVCDQLQEYTRIRDLEMLYHTFTRKLNNGSATSLEIITDIDAKMSEIVETDNSDKLKVTHIAEELPEFYDRLQRKSRDNEFMTTGYKQLDLTLGGGIKCGEYMVIAARPGMGKTSFGLNMLANNIKEGRSCLFFSLEMTKQQICQRLICSEAEITSNSVRNSDIKRGDRQKLEDASRFLYSSQFYVNDSPNLTVYDIQGVARRHVRAHPDCKIIVVDYIQKLIMSDPKLGTTLNGNINSTVLCNLAKQLKVTIVVLAQLNRDCEKRPGCVPKMSDLKESGQIEQDAHQALLLYRGYKYGASKGKDGPAYQEHEVDVIVDKNREGDTGVVELIFEGRFTKFYDVDEWSEKNPGYKQETENNDMLNAATEIGF